MKKASLSVCCIMFFFMLTSCKEDIQVGEKQVSAGNETISVSKSENFVLSLTPFTGKLSAGIKDYESVGGKPRIAFAKNSDYGHLIIPANTDFVYLNVDEVNMAQLSESGFLEQAKLKRVKVFLDTNQPRSDSFSNAQKLLFGVSISGTDGMIMEKVDDEADKKDHLAFTGVGEDINSLADLLPGYLFPLPEEKQAGGDIPAFANARQAASSGWTDDCQSWNQGGGWETTWINGPWSTIQWRKYVRTKYDVFGNIRILYPGKYFLGDFTFESVTGVNYIPTMRVFSGDDTPNAGSYANMQKLAFDPSFSVLPAAMPNLPAFSRPVYIANKSKSKLLIIREIQRHLYGEGWGYYNGKLRVKTSVDDGYQSTTISCNWVGNYTNGIWDNKDLARLKRWYGQFPLTHEIRSITMSYSDY